MFNVLTNFSGLRYDTVDDHRAPHRAAVRETAVGGLKDHWDPSRLGRQPWRRCCSHRSGRGRGAACRRLPAAGPFVLNQQAKVWWVELPPRIVVDIAFWTTGAALCVFVSGVVS